MPALPIHLTPDRSRPARSRLKALAVLLLAGLGAGACRPRVPPNLLLVVVDTLRQDHLGCYGYPLPTSPSIDALAASGTRFEAAYATAPWTKPSVASMLTGLYPPAHGLEGHQRHLLPALETVAERLSGAGYATAATVSHVLLSARVGFGQGFDRYLESAAGGPDHLSTPEVTRQAVAFLEELGGGERPFFLLAHYFDPHYNYRPHPEYGLAPPSAGRLDGSQGIGALRQMAADLSPEEVAYLRALYDGEIRYTDEGIGALLAALDRLGLADHTVVVLTADHGEELLDRGWIGHTRTLYQELVRVPLVIRRPGARPRSVAQPVSLVSLAATLFDAAGLEVPSDLDGPSLLPLVAGRRLAPQTPFFDVDFVPLARGIQVKRARKRGLVAGPLKVIRDELADSLELYDLDADPGEVQNLAGERPNLATRLDRALAVASRKRAPAPGSPEDAPSEEEIEQLRSLGYVGD
jgi:arylsulfatase A-like enzyme